MINTTDSPDELRELGGINLNAGVVVGTVDATGIALKNGLGSKLLPIINTTILGAVVKMTGVVSLKSLGDAIVETISKRGDANRQCAKEAFESVVF